MAFLAELRPKGQHQKNVCCFSEKMVTKMIQKSAEYWYSEVFTDETQVKLTSDGIVRVFRKKKHSLCAKKTSKM